MIVIEERSWWPRPVLVVWAVVDLMLVEFDNVIGIVRGRHLREFLAYCVGESCVADLVAERAGSVAWTTRHRDWMHETCIECVTVDGGTCTWVFSLVPPRPWVERGPFYVTPTNPGAAELLPELVPLGYANGREFPTGGPYSPGAIHDIAEPDRARAYLESWLQKKGWAPSR
jgi:hypothetical protein